MLKRMHCGRPLSVIVVSDSELLAMTIRVDCEDSARKFSG